LRDRSWEDTIDSSPKPKKSKKSSSSSLPDRSWEDTTNPKPTNIHADDDREARRVSPSTIHADDNREARRLQSQVRMNKGTPIDFIGIKFIGPIYPQKKTFSTPPSSKASRVNPALLSRLPSEDRDGLKPSSKPATPHS
jgi:hypothetical protein